MDKFLNIGMDKLITSIYDFGGLTTQEVWCKFAQKINIIIEHFNYLEKTVTTKQELMDKKLEFLLGQGFNNIVAKLLLEKINDGTISKIIVENVYNDLLKQMEDIKTELDSNINTNAFNLDKYINKNDASITQINKEYDNLSDTVDNVKINVNTKYDDVILTDDVLEFYANELLKKTIKLNLNKNSRIYNSIKSNKKCYKIAHRGLSGAYPENTLLAIKKAGEYNCDMVEFDVNYTKDNKFILMHDDTIDRTTNGTGNTNTLTLTEIKELNIDGGKNSDIFTNLKVPTLEEALLQCKTSNLIPFIELKSQIPTSLCNSIVSILDSFDMVETVIITSFNHDLLFKIQQINRKITICPIADLTLVNVNKFKDRDNTLLSVPYPSNFDFEALKEANSKGLPVMTWTVNDKESIDLLQSKNIDGIISDVYNAKKDRKFLILNSVDTTTFKNNYEFNTDVVKITKKDTKTLLLTWDIPFFGNERPIAFANEDSGDKIGIIPLTRGTKNNSVEIKFRKIGQSTFIDLTEINIYNVYFNIIVLGN